MRWVVDREAVSSDECKVEMESLRRASVEGRQGGEVAGEGWTTRRESEE